MGDFIRLQSRFTITQTNNPGDGHLIVAYVQGEQYNQSINPCTYSSDRSGVLFKYGIGAILFHDALGIESWLGGQPGNAVAGSVPLYLPEDSPTRIELQEALKVGQNYWLRLTLTKQYPAYSYTIPGVANNFPYIEAKAEVYTEEGGLRKLAEMKVPYRADVAFPLTSKLKGLIGQAVSGSNRTTFYAFDSF